MKRSIAFLLAIFMVLGSGGGISLATEEPSKGMIKDSELVEDSEETDKSTKIKIENKEKVEKIKYLDGYGDLDNFRPEKPATRLEFISWIDKLLDIEAPRNEDIVFKDLNKEMKTLINKFVDAELVSGYEDGRFRPDKGLTRAEATKVLRSAFKIEDKTKRKSGFKDIDNHWAKDDIEVLSNNGYIKGYPDGNFNPDKTISRAELITIINSIIKIDTSYNIGEIEFEDLTEDHWAFDSIMKVILR